MAYLVLSNGVVFEGTRIGAHIDRIGDLWIKDGRIVEQGNHEQLVANNGLYSHLCSLQAFS